MKTQADFIKGCHAAVDHLFAHRKVLRRASVRFAFWPDGLVISANVTARTDQELKAGRVESIPWDQLDTIDAAEFIAIIDRVCQPSHEVLGAGGVA